jgi:hypothetical protein
MCTVVNLRSSTFTVYIGRPGHGLQGPFGNPFVVGVHGTRGECVRLFEEWFASDTAKEYRELIHTRIIPNDVLGCFCKPAACHGDIIARYVNNGYRL